MSVLVTTEMKLLTILAELEPGEQPTYGALGKKMGCSESNAHRAMMSLAALHCVKLTHVTGKRTSYRISDLGRAYVKRESAYDRLTRFFREERPDLGFEGDVEGWDAVECAMHNLRRKPGGAP